MRLQKFKNKTGGLSLHRQAVGFHEIWFNPANNRYTTIPNHPGDMPEGTFRAILSQAGITPDEFLDKWRREMRTFGPPLTPVQLYFLDPLQTLQQPVEFPV